jgi:hypothetical protein
VQKPRKFAVEPQLCECHHVQLSRSSPQARCQGGGCSHGLEKHDKAFLSLLQAYLCVDSLWSYQRKMLCRNKSSKFPRKATEERKLGATSLTQCLKCVSSLNSFGGILLCFVKIFSNSAVRTPELSSCVRRLHN